MTLFDLESLPIAHAAEQAFTRVPPVTALERDFPAAVLSRIGEHESWRKEIHRPATSTHKWWAKRLGSVFRGILTAAVTEDEAAALGVYRSGAALLIRSDAKRPMTVVLPIFGGPSIRNLSGRDGE